MIRLSSYVDDTDGPLFTSLPNDDGDDEDDDDDEDDEDDVDDDEDDDENDEDARFFRESSTGYHH